MPWFAEHLFCREVRIGELTLESDFGDAWGKRIAPPPPSPPGGGGAKRSTQQLESENAEPRRENEYLRQQRDILKKTLGILSEPPTNGIGGLTR